MSRKTVLAVIGALTILGLVGTGLSVAFLVAGHGGHKEKPGSTFTIDTGRSGQR